MTATRLPGFFGEASLYMSGTSHARAVHHGVERTIYPASYIDQGCLRGCLRDCGSECAGSGSGKASCIRQCALDNAQCWSACTRPGNPTPLICPPGQTICGGTCTDLNKDPMNCGACGVSCTECCYFGTCGVNVMCPDGPGCCPTGFPHCRNVPLLGKDRCLPI